MIRVISAAVLIALVLVAVWCLPWGAMAGVALVVAAVAATELAGLAAHAGAPVPSMYLACVTAVLAAAFGLHGTYVLAGGDALAPALLAAVLLSGLLTLAWPGPPSPAAFARAGVMSLAPMYVGLPLGALIWVQVMRGPQALTWMLAVIALSDSAQYYTGRAFGRRKLAPAVSPAKTVEGAIGGLLAAGVAGAALGAWWLPDVSPAMAALAALALAALGIAGDLFESLLKRSAGVKDASSLIPGHGGVLDRIDSYLFAAPGYYLFLRFLS
jgi:phosphatidate cytidylyltransferase